MTTLAQSLTTAVELITSGDPVVRQVLLLSLQVSGSACALGAGVGLLLGAWLAVARFPGHGVAVWLLNTLLALPSVVVGLVVYLLLSRSGPLGSLGILFTPAAMVVAQSILVVPLIAALTRRLVIDAMAEGGDQLRSMGAGPLASAALLLVHERLSVLTVLNTFLAVPSVVVGLLVYLLLSRTGPLGFLGWLQPQGLRSAGEGAVG